MKSSKESLPPETVLASPRWGLDGAQWHCFVDPPRRGSANMEVDRMLLQWAEKSSEPVTCIRFYQWAHPTVSLGKHQKADQALDLDYCQKESIELVWRPTGGRAVLHDKDVTYSVVSNNLDIFRRNIEGTYLQIARALQAGLTGVGVEAVLCASRDSNHARHHSIDSPCFVSASRYEILVGGKKIIGSAQRRLKRSFLQHGSIPLSLDFERLGRVFAIRPSVLRHSMTSISQVSGRDLDPTRLSEALRAGFESEFGIRLGPTSLTEMEYTPEG